MDVLKPSIQIKPLRFSENPADYALYRAALEWDLIDPIVIESPEDLKSTRSWADKVQPYQHQVSNLISFCRRLPVTLLADDVGLGKTISAGLVASELISRGRLSKILIVAPKILGPQWQEELETKFGIPSIIATGKGLLDAEPPGDIGAVITTYNSARMYLTRLRDAGFDMLILDEAHKLRNLYGTDTAPQVALRFKEILADRVFKYVLLLTATPIQNRLWDLYSLVELLTVARGHENPFGNPGTFSRKFIADNRTDARKLNTEAQEEFRSIIYGYMSRVRRGDADLHFPGREVQLHSVNPSPGELELIKVVATYIGDLDRLTQINILKTLVSSPEALTIMLKGMAERGTVKKEFAVAVKEVAKTISLTSKLQGLETLVDKLRAEKPTQWRMVVFTTRIETQTSIQNFLEERGISCGLINGTTGSTNKDTLEKFRKDDPEINVMISTEAGAEGVNLQVANVLVNYDLPWNPMIVEQRIGRVQRLGSVHEKVCIFNIVLKDTFEDYIVGRLMEKLQMASHAIGDIESLLEASGLGEGEDSSEVFEQKVLKLVLASLQGKDIGEAAKRAERSIENAKIQLEKEEENINSMLGSMDESYDTGPQSPILPKVIRSMDVKDFVLSGLKSLGATLTQKTPEFYLSELNKKQELIRFDNNLSIPVADGPLLRNVLYAPGSPAFERLVSKVTNVGLHRVEDADANPKDKLEAIVKEWVDKTGASYLGSKITGVRRTFSGAALVRVRVTVAHDSYERLVEIPCSHSEHIGESTKLALDPLDNTILNEPSLIGISPELLIDRALLDAGVSEFCRFYRERLSQELKNAGLDPAKKKKIEDDFTPRLECALVGLEGFVRRQFETNASYRFGESDENSSALEVLPSLGETVSAPKLAKCEETGKSVPVDCLDRCDISRKRVLRYLLVKSDTSDRKALQKYIVKCEYTGKHVLNDEVEKSDVTGHMVLAMMLKESALSGKKGEPDAFGKCDFTGAELLLSELGVSQVSGKTYRLDEAGTSSVSGKTGHRTEFVKCVETNSLILPEESEICEVTGKVVTKGLLEECEISGKKVLPSKLETSSLSGKKALKKYFVSSSISDARLLKEEAIKSAAGKFCLPVEAKECAWSHRLCHIDDLKFCSLTNLAFYFQFIKEKDAQSRLEVLSDLLDEVQRGLEIEVTENMRTNLAFAIKHKTCEVESNKSNPDKKIIAICFSGKSFLGLRTRHFGALYSLDAETVVGKIAEGSRNTNGWTPN